MLDGSKYGRKQDDDYISASDEEILPLEGLSSEDDEDSEDEDEDDEEVSDGQDDNRSLVDEEDRDEEEELDNEAWGSSRKAYYGADDVSDEEDEKLEEQEAERLQKKHLSRLRPEDFLDTWADITTSSSKPTTTSGRYITEELPAPDFSKLSKEEVLKILKSRHPEVPRLAGLYQRLVPELAALELLSKRPFHPQHEVIVLQFASLSVFLASIAMLFAVRADNKERKSMERKMIAKIVELERIWSQISAIPIAKDAVDVQDVLATETKLDNLVEQSTKAVSTAKKTGTLKRKRPVKTLADDDSEDDLAATLALLKKSRKVKSKRTDDDLDDDFAESKFLHSVDAQEKSQNRKSLQFYAAQIAQKGAKRREKYSGDMEVFKERRNDRNERQIEEARKRGLPNPTLDSTALNNHNPSDSEADNPDTSRKHADPDSEYYDLIAAKKAAKKAHGKESYETSKAAARAYILGMTNEAELDESGKRLITRQIEKNKGLTPKRSKDVRNPRVKKRKKYEKKKIALKGRQQVYVVGDRRRGNYGGEESGINKNVVRGVKLQ